MSSLHRRLNANEWPTWAQTVLNQRLGILKLDTWGMGMSHGPSTVGKCVPLPLTNNQKTTLTYLPYYEYYLPFILYRFHTHCWNWVKPAFIPKLHRKNIYIYIYIYYLVPVFCGPSPLGLSPSRSHSNNENMYLIALLYPVLVWEM